MSKELENRKCVVCGSWITWPIADIFEDTSKDVCSLECERKLREV